MIAEVSFSASDDTDPGMPRENQNRVVFQPDIDRDFFGAPMHDRVAFEAWCAERNLRILGEITEPTGLYVGEVYFETAEQRLEFKMRWNV